MPPSLVLLVGAFLVQEPVAQKAPDPETLLRVTYYHRLMFRDAETPFLLRQEFVQADEVPSSSELEDQAKGEQVVIEACRPARVGAAGQWLWPRSLEERRRQCTVHGESDERQP